MTRSETAMLLGYAAAYDSRLVDDTAVMAWHDLLGDLPADDVRDAIRRHYQRSPDRIMPAHIRAECKVIRDERRRSEVVRALPPGKHHDDPERAERIARNHARLHAVLSEIARKRSIPADDSPPLTGSDLIRQRALDRARGERRSDIA